jgi:hypothetical protein
VMDAVHEPSRAIGRDISKGERAETDIKNLTERRHNQRALEEGERPVEEVWRVSERREEARRKEENRGSWLSWYRRLERGYLERAAECAQRAGVLEITRATELKGVTK